VSVTVHFSGGFGNNIFQYMCARLFSMENGLRLLTPWIHQEALPVTPFEGGEIVEGRQTVGIGEGMTPLAHPYSPNPYHFIGYFQKSSWYTSRREKIESFSRPGVFPSRNSRDVLMHLRLGDFKQCRIAIHPSWYLGILDQEYSKAGGSRLIIVTNEPDPEYLANFSKYDPHVVCTNYGHDWNFMRQFDRVICSNSTFAWWSFFFGRPKRIYMFKRWIGNPGMEMDTFENQTVVDGRFLHE